MSALHAEPLMDLHELPDALGTKDVATPCLVGVKDDATAGRTQVALVHPGHEAESVSDQDGVQLP